MKREKAISLCIKELTGNINDDEKGLLKSWLNESRENVNEFEQLEKSWMKTKPQNPAEVPDIDSEWILLSQKLELNKSVIKNSFAERWGYSIKNILGNTLKPAIAFGIVLLIASVIYFLPGEESPKYEMAEISTGNGIHKTIVLPDGSSVTLNSGSSIRYTEPLSEKTREIELTGEGYFSVKKDGRPFVVKTDNAKITVLGTKFNVWARNAKTKVVVKEGLVRLADEVDDSKSVKIAGSETSTIVGENEPSIPSHVDAERLLGWMEGKLVFNKSSLQEITGELARFYNLKFIIEDEELNDLTMTGSFKDEDPDTLLSMVCLALGVDYTRNGNEYVIKKK